MAHTPGPWEVRGSWVFPQNKDDIDDIVHMSESDLRSSSERMANARLIAAAPELVEALRGCADALREAGKDFALANPLAARPNLYELHEQTARAILTKIDGKASE